MRRPVAEMFIALVLIAPPTAATAEASSALGVRSDIRGFHDTVLAK